MLDYDVISTLPLLNQSNYFYSLNSTMIGKCKWTSLNSAITSVLLLSFALNALAAIVVFRVPLVSNRGRSNPLHLCIRFLNAVDMIQSLVLLAMPLFADDNCKWEGGNPSCKVWGFVALFLLLVSPLVTIMMAIDRVIALYQPFKYRSNVGLKTFKFLLPLFCCVTMLICAFPLVGVGEYHVVRGRRMCLLDTITDDLIDRIYVIMVHSLFLVALLVMVGCTATFQFKLVLLSKNKATTSQCATLQRNRRTRNATVTTMAVCLIFVVCYAPYVIRVIAEASSGVKSNVWIARFTFVLAFLQPMLNPIVCVCANNNYRTKMQKIFHRRRISDFGLSSDGATSTDQRRPFSALNYESRKQSLANREAVSSSDRAVVVNYFKQQTHPESAF